MSLHLTKHIVNDKECHKNADKNAVSNEFKHGISLSAVVKSYPNQLNDDTSSLSYVFMFNKLPQVMNDICDK